MTKSNLVRDKDRSGAIFSLARNEQKTHTTHRGHAFKAGACVSPGQLSTLHVTAEMHVQHYVRAADQKASADKGMAASSQGVTRALEA